MFSLDDLAFGANFADEDDGEFLQPLERMMTTVTTRWRQTGPRNPTQIGRWYPKPFALDVEDDDEDDEYVLGDDNDGDDEGDDDDGEGLAEEAPEIVRTEYPGLPAGMPLNLARAASNRADASRTAEAFMDYAAVEREAIGRRTRSQLDLTNKEVNMLDTHFHRGYALWVP